MPEIRIPGVKFLGESSVSKAINICQIVNMLSHVSYADCQAKVGPQTWHAQQKRGPGYGTRCRSRPRKKKSQAPLIRAGPRCGAADGASRVVPRPVPHPGPSFFLGGAVRGEKSFQVFTSRLEAPPDSSLCQDASAH